MASKARDAKTALMAGALVLTGVCEFLEGLERGDDVLECASTAVRRTRLRGKAIKEASAKVSRQGRAKRRKVSKGHE